ncbi:MAG: class IV adenylate cyclase [Acidobacteriaceae bacterium]
MKNIEFKVKINDPRKIALSHLQGKMERLDQTDYYFSYPKGRLKIRKQNNQPYCEIIYYNRPNISASKISDYRIYRIPKKHLSDLIGAFTFIFSKPVIVKKIRRLGIIKNTRVHIDKVEKLGNFLELETVLNKTNMKIGMIEQAGIIKELRVSKYKKVKYSYVDLMRNYENRRKQN